MAAPAVVMVVMAVASWACLAVVLVEADDASRPQLPIYPPFPILFHSQSPRSKQSNHLLLEALRPKHLVNDIREQDIIASRKTNERFNVDPLLWGVLSRPRPLSSLGLAGRSWTPHEMFTKSSPEYGGTYEYIPTSMLISKTEDEVQSRQKRHTLKHKLRSIAVPLSVFNFLGFLPVRVPGLPYHNDLPSPDYSHYETKHDIFIPRYRRRKTFRRY